VSLKFMLVKVTVYSFSYTADTNASLKKPTVMKLFLMYIIF